MYSSVYMCVCVCVCVWCTHTHTQTTPCIYLDGGVAVSLDQSRRNEPGKLGAKGYSRDMKTWRL